MEKQAVLFRRGTLVICDDNTAISRVPRKKLFADQKKETLDEMKDGNEIKKDVLLLSKIKRN